MPDTKLRAVLTDGQGRRAQFFYATRQREELYYGPNLDIKGVAGRVSYHGRGMQIVRSPQDGALLSQDQAAELERADEVQAPQLTEFRGAAERWVAVPRPDQLKWVAGEPVDDEWRRHAVASLADLPARPTWCFRFWLVERGRLDIVERVTEQYDLLGPVTVVDTVQPMLVGFFARSSPFVVAMYMEGVRQMKDDVGLTLNAPLLPTESAGPGPQ